jgi:hypothetical protein
MGVLLLVGRYAAGEAFTGEPSQLTRVVALAVLIAVGGGAYFIAAHLTGAMRWGELKATLGRGRTAGAAPLPD